MSGASPEDKQSLIAADVWAAQRGCKRTRMATTAARCIAALSSLTTPHSHFHLSKDVLARKPLHYILQLACRWRTGTKADCLLYCSFASQLECKCKCTIPTAVGCLETSYLAVQVMQQSQVYRGCHATCIMLCLLSRLA